MVTVTGHGKRFQSQNPAKPVEWTWQRVVIFTEEGRIETGRSINRSSAALSAVLRKAIGLKTVRTHSQPIPEDQMGDFQVGTVHNLFINRALYSTAQMRAQENVTARMYEGNMTFFVTELGTTQLDDRDERLSKETAAKLAPEQFFSARTTVANVRDAEPEPTPVVETSVVAETEHVDLNAA